MLEITYDEACDFVKDVKSGTSQKVFCVVVVSENCKFCKDMMKDVMKEVEEKFEKDVDFMKLDIGKEKSDSCIFPITDTPTFLFYIKNANPFITLRQGTAPAKNVIQDVEALISVNKRLNGAHI